MSALKRYARVSAASNTVILQRTAGQGPARLHGVVGTFPAGSVARIDDSHSFTEGVLNINAAGSNTVGHFGANVTNLDIGINTGIVVAVSSNAQVTIVYE